MKKIKHWAEAFRLRTLPLSLSGVIMGSMLAASNNAFSAGIFLMAVLTTLFLQILSNLANDFGDSELGTDNAKRVGPVRTLQGGLVTRSEMKIMIAVFIVLSLFSGISLLFLAFEKIHTKGLIIMLLIGIISILSAVFYTIGKKPYGYLGLGDMFVFIFFGLVSVQGTYFLFTGSYDISTLIPAISVGLLSAGVLNLNNMRDHINDKASGKHTLVVRIGLLKAKIYHYFLIGTALLSSFLYLIITQNILVGLAFIIPVIPLIYNIIKVYGIHDPREFDPELKKLALSTLLFTVSFGILQLLPLC